MSSPHKYVTIKGTQPLQSRWATESSPEPQAVSPPVPSQSAPPASNLPTGPGRATDPPANEVKKPKTHRGGRKHRRGSHKPGVDDEVRGFHDRAAAPRSSRAAPTARQAQATRPTSVPRTQSSPLVPKAKVDFSQFDDLGDWADEA